MTASKLNLNRYEKAMLGVKSGPREFRSLVSGVSRVARLAKMQDNGHKQAIWETGACVIGPVFFFYVWWILESARRSGIERLWFLGRDGEVLLKIADVINKRWGYGIECRYLNGSRQAWFLASFSAPAGFDLNWILSEDNGFLSAKMVCDRLDMDPSASGHFLEKYGFTQDDLELDISRLKREQIETFLRDEDVVKIITENSRRRLEAAAAYLKQEGLAEKKKYGLVDIGWGARSQFALSRISEKAGFRPVDGLKGFYFGLSEQKTVYENDSLFPYFFDLTKSGRNGHLRNNAIYETFAASARDRVTGHRKQGGVYVPVLDERSGEIAEKWGVDVQQDSVLRFAEEFAGSCGPGLPDEGAARDISEAILHKFIRTPCYDEACAYGSFLISLEQTEEGVRELAPLLGHKDLWMIAFKRGYKYKGFWFDGTLVRSKMTVLSFLFRMYINLKMRKVFIS